MIILLLTDPVIKPLVITTKAIEFEKIMAMMQRYCEWVTQLYNFRKNFTLMAANMMMWLITTVISRIVEILHTYFSS